MESTVDFPHPELPTMLTNSFLYTENEMLLRASISPDGVLYFMDTFSSFISSSLLPQACFTAGGGKRIAFSEFK